MNRCPTATKFLHGCSEEQMVRIEEAGVEIIDIQRYEVGKREVFVLVIPEEQWKLARNIKHIEKHEEQ